MLYKKLLGIFLLVFLVHGVRATVGISPPIYEINFQSSLGQTFPFTITTDNQDNEFDVSLVGDFAEYATLSSNRVKGSFTVDVNLNLPERYDKPGRHVLYVVITEVLPPERLTGGIVVQTAVRGWVVINIPYPGEYAEIEFSAEDANAGEPVDFNLKLYSRGDNEIKTNSRIEIYEAGKLGDEIAEEPSLSPELRPLLAPRTVSGRYVETLNLGEDSIPSQQFVEINAKLDTLNYKSGIYKAVAAVEQSDQILRNEKFFKLGELFVDISDWSNEFERGKTDSIIIELESYWNDPIENVYVDGEIIGTNIRFQTPSVPKLYAFEKQRVTGFFDTSEIEGDKFQAKLTVNYEGKKTEKIVDLHFVRKTDYLLITLVAVLILAALFFLYVIIDFLFLRKRNGKK